MIRKHYSNANEKDVNCNKLESEFNAEPQDDYETSLIQLEFVKSALTINPCMVNVFKIFSFCFIFVFNFHLRATRVTYTYKERTNCM